MGPTLNVQKRAKGVNQFKQVFNQGTDRIGDCLQKRGYSGFILKSGVDDKKKLNLILKLVFSFVGYKCNLDTVIVKPTQDSWQKIQDLICKIKHKSVLSARCLMSPVIELLAVTKKLVPEGRLHMMPFLWHHKKYEKFPESIHRPFLVVHHNSSFELVAETYQTC